MKPFIIFKELKDNKVELTKEELEDLIVKAYDQGNSDGYIKGKQEADNFHYQLHKLLVNTIFVAIRFLVIA